MDAYLEAIGRGMLDWQSVAEISRANVREGIHSEAIHRLAMCGTSGKHDQNLERDAIRWLQNLWNIQVETYELEVELEDEHGKLEETTIDILLLHEILGAIWRQGHLQQIASLFGEDGKNKNKR